MLWITDKFGTTTNWHIGTRPPHFFTDDIKEVAADGDELDFVLINFKNIPTPPKAARFAVWSGDFAAFIAKNLTQ